MIKIHGFAIFKTLIPLMVLWCGCSTSPLMTGKPGDWQWHKAEELRTALGEPTRIIPQHEGEIWEYRHTDSAILSGTSSTQFGAGNVPFQGIRGNIETTTTPAGVGKYENVNRYLIVNGRVRKWFAARYENGKETWSDH